MIRKNSFITIAALVVGQGDERVEREEREHYIYDSADGFTGKQLVKSDEGLAALDGRREGRRVLGRAGPQHHLQGQMGRLLKYTQAPTFRRLVARRDSHV